MTREPGCPSCASLPDGRNCGGHWSRMRTPRNYAGTRDTATRGKPDLDKQEGNETR